MKAIRVHEYGSFEQLRYEEAEIPSIQDDQILVRVCAASVNHLDLLKVSGRQKNDMPLEFPWIPGHDFAGVAEKTGAAVTHIKEGDKVYGNCMGGSFAEYLAAPAKTTVKMPEFLSFTEATTVPHVGETAWQALYKYGMLTKGQTVLIHGAAGGVGSFAVQLAKNTGANILATAGPQDLGYVKTLGADQVLNYKAEDFSKTLTGINLVLLLAGTDTEERSYSVLTQGGTLVSTVGLSHAEEATKKGIHALSMSMDQSGEDLEKITVLIKEDRIKTDVGVTLSLSNAATAWKLLSGDQSVPHPAHGKIVLEINTK